MWNKIGKSRKKRLLRFLIMAVTTCVVLFAAAPAYARATGNDNQTTERRTNDDGFNLNITSNAGSVELESTLQILIILTVLSLAPSILIMVTCFTRVIVVFHFLRTAMGTQTTPPNQVIVGLSLFITLAVMSPVMTQINDDAVQPFISGQLDQDAAIERGIAPLRTFMMGQTRDKDLDLFMKINDAEAESYEEIPMTVVIPAFIISELRTAFIIGFVLYLPFIVMDMVVASTLMSMGMMMLPPTVISLPFKILLFILADGWNLVVGSLIESFNR